MEEIRIGELIALGDHYKERLKVNLGNLSEDGVAEECVVIGKRLEAIFKAIDDNTDILFELNQQND